MFKADVKIVKELLGTTDVKEIIPCKSARYYYKGHNIGDSVLILTPCLHEDGEYLNNIVSMQKMAGYPVRAIEYKVSRNRAYQFEPI